MNLRTLLPVVVGAAAALALPAAAPAASNTLVINEIDYDQPSTDTAEFLELANVSGGAIDLDPYTVQLVNGNAGGAAVYRTIELPAVSLAAGDVYVICANAANTANCDQDVAPDTDWAQNGAPDGVGLRNGPTLVDALSYEGNTGAPYTEGSGLGLEDTGAVGEGLSRCGADTDVNNADFSLRAITPGAANTCPPPPIPFGACGDGLETPIHAIQGSGAASSATGEQRLIEGVVVGDFAGAGGLGGFFVQEEDADADDDPRTSEGVFVASGQAVDTGDVVRVRGTVAESFARTQIGTVTRVEVCPGDATASTTTVQLPVSSMTDWEPLEGMAVTFPQDLTISEYFDFDRFNETVLSVGRQMTPTAVVEPGSAAYTALLDQNLRGRIMLDDGRNTENSDPAIHPDGAVFDLSHRFRGGDTVGGVTGVLDFAFGDYRVQPTAAAEYTEVNERPAEPEPVGGNVKVASFNVLNYFTTLDGRGANTPEEFERQRTKIIAAITEIDPAVVGLIEIQNNDEALQDLVDGLNDATSPGRYDFIETGVIGTDEIKVAFAYQPARVTPVGDHAILDSSVDPRFIDTKNRPALAQTFRTADTGGVFTAVINHLKSKGSDCDDVGDPDTGDGAGNCNLTRTAAAEALVDWLATDPTGSGDDDVLILGDLNSYDKEDPIDALLAGGYTDLIREFQGENAYSYVFDGMIGYLDHGLASEGLADEVTGATEWHINADEPDILDYDMTFKQPAQEALYEPNAYRSSDHDPVIVGLDACDEIAPEIEVSVTPDSLWPPNHKYRTVQATVTATDNLDEEPDVRVLSATSNEPDNAPGGGDGDTTNDIVVVDEDTFQVRAERDENRSGRVYTITYEVTDSCGNSSTASATVGVPVRR
ncbi:MAG: ExeM/NucH family extracellular endonuclease [Solirubrobacteraceae bacterium]